MPRKHGYEWHPMDAAILERLPTEGSSVGYHTIVGTVKRIIVEMNRGVPTEGQVTHDQVAARLRSMQVAGLVVAVAAVGTSGRRGWQRTRKGELMYAEHTGRSLGPPPLRQIEGGAS